VLLIYSHDSHQLLLKPKLSDLSKAKNRFTQVNADLEIVAIQQSHETVLL